MRTLEQIKKIGIAGAGTMGAGIAQVCAQAGYEVIMYDLSKESTEKAVSAIGKSLNFLVEKGKISADEAKAATSRVQCCADLETFKADLFIEAVIEDPAIKGELFRMIAENNAEDAILATNTSSIPVTQIATHVKNPSRFVGIHFFNPAHIMKLVEVVSGAETDPAVAELSRDFVKKIGKTPIMAKDAPGFIVNRVARHYYVEALKLMEENICSFEDIDALMEASGFKMGPFRLMDLIGVDTNFSVTSSMFRLFHYDGKFRPSRIQQQKVDAGHHGRKSGRGFYQYQS